MDDLNILYETGINSIKGSNIIKKFVEINDNRELVLKYPGNPVKCIHLVNTNIFIIGFGKAVLDMCEGFLMLLNNYNTNADIPVHCDSGILSIPVGLGFDKNIFKQNNIEIYSGAKNNMPDSDSLNTTGKIIHLLTNINRMAKNNQNNRYLIISFISGGGSACLSYPKPPLNISDKCSIIMKLVKSGCPIQELNQVRCALSGVKAGRLAKIALSQSSNIEMINFIASDIINDPIELIASGPTVLSHLVNISQKAMEILTKYGIDVNEKISFALLNENPDFKEIKCQNNLSNIIIVNNSRALEAVISKANEMGYKTMFGGADITGEAAEIGKSFAHKAIDNYDRDKFKGICYISGGESTVNLGNSKGVGGRCQEMCLSYFLESRNIKRDQFFMAAGTDGQDGPTPYAGCIVPSVSEPDNEVFDKAAESLKSHNSMKFWEEHYSTFLIKKGLTGVNVMDIFCLIKR